MSSELTKEEIQVGLYEVLQKEVSKLQDCNVRERVRDRMTNRILNKDSWENKSREDFEKWAYPYIKSGVWGCVSKYKISYEGSAHHSSPDYKMKSQDRDFIKEMDSKILFADLKSFCDKRKGISLENITLKDRLDYAAKYHLEQKGWREMAKELGINEITLRSSCNRIAKWAPQELKDRYNEINTL